MKPVRTMPRFQCDFCKKRGVQHSIEKHEKRCYRNPERFCDTCENTGKTVHQPLKRNIEDVGKPCKYCAKFDAQQLAEIEARESAE